MKYLFVILFLVIVSVPLYSLTDSTVFDSESYAAEIEMKYQDAVGIKGAYMKKNLFENTEGNYSMSIDAYFDGDYFVLVDSYENDNGEISDEEFFFSGGNLVMAILKKKSKDEENYTFYKCFFLEQMMVMMIDEKENKHDNDSREFKKAQERVSWRISELMDLLYK